VDLLDRMLSTRVRPAIVKRVIGHRLFIKLNEKDRDSNEEVNDDDQQMMLGDWVDQVSLPPLIIYSIL
jgi:hypothetical protein